MGAEEPRAPSTRPAWESLPPSGPTPGDQRGERLQLRVRVRMRRWRAAWQVFTQNRMGLLGLAVIAAFGLAALAHPILMATTWDVRTYDPLLGYSAPAVELTVVTSVTDPATEVSVERARLRGRLDAQPGDVFVDRLQPAPPSRQHLLGTDPLGRDVLSQLLYSARAAFLMAAIAATVTAVLGTMMGALAAYFGGTTNALLMRLADLLLLMPLIPLLIFVSGVFEVGLPTLGLLIGVASGLGPTAIVLKSQALTVTVKPFIDAARLAGGGHWHIVTRHIVPNLLPLSFLYMMFTVTTAIGAEATLSFFGLLDVPMSWGIMIHTAQSAGYLLRGTQYWWLLVPAGGAVTLFAAAFYLVGRGMDDVVNPRLRQP